MTRVITLLTELVEKTKDLPPIRRNSFGQIEGWPDSAESLLKTVIQALVEASKEDLLEAALFIEETADPRVPRDLLVLLARLIWDLPNGPDPVDVARRSRR